MKKKNIQFAHTHLLPRLVWSLCLLTGITYASGVGMITYNVVERKSVQSDIKKMSVRIAESEFEYAEKIKTIQVKNSPIVAVQYITTQASTFGFAQ